MKHILSILILTFSCLPVAAQKGLNVEEIFDGDIVAKTYMVENFIKGEQLSRYKLTFFRSIKFKATAEERSKIEARVNEDIKHAIDLEQERRGGDQKAGEPATLSYAMMTLPANNNEKSKRNYLCYQCSPMRNGYAITLVFMQGYATINELRKMFKKK